MSEKPEREERPTPKLTGSEAERALSLLVEGSPDAVSRFDRELRCLWVNHALEVVTGRSSGELLGRSFRELGVAVEFTEPWDAALREVFRTGEPRILELRHPSPRGWRWYQTHLIPEVGEDGTVESVFTVCRDIERLKETEATRRRVEVESRVREAGRFRSLIENVTDLITILDPDGTILYQSGSLERILGYRQEERIGRSAFEIVHPDDRERMTAAISEGLAKPGTVQLGEIRARHRDGSWRHLEAVGANRLDDPDIAGIVVVSRDITERKRAEEDRRGLEEQLLQAQKMEAVGRLAGGIAHDFNNLLTAIGGYTDLLAARISEDDEMRADLEEIRKATNRAATLTRQLLAFSRRQVMRPRRVDLNDIVEGVEKMLHTIIGEDLDLVTVLEPGPKPVLADPGQLEQVIVNLAVNSRDAMPRGGELTIATRSLEVRGDAGKHADLAPGRYVALVLRDTGQGMPPEVRERIFEPFFTTKEKGTGLGLSTVYGIVRQSEGQIYVRSEPGHGTTFEVVLPQADPPSGEHPVVGEATQAQGGSESVLVVEDEEGVRNVARRALEKSGYTVLVAADGEQALELMERHQGPLDLVITDIVMPRMGGQALASRLTEKHPDTPVLFISGYAESALGGAGSIAEGAPILEKPFTPEALVRRVRQILDASD